MQPDISILSQKYSNLFQHPTNNPSLKWLKQQVCKARGCKSVVMLGVDDMLSYVMKVMKVDSCLTQMGKL